ncbi:MAG: methylated-DNA--[protein]-cysteine S-methyltransferase [Nitrospirae bacterium]|nr:methylated-DNA--[protein]-cysteine S-methyltransferase [Nitrospirota bacterium]
MRPVPAANASRKSSHPVIYYTLVASPVGPIGIAATPRGLCRVSLNVAGPSAFRKKLEKDHGCSAARRDRHFTGIVTGLRAYFSGRPVRFKAKIDLREGTPFQQKVWRSLQRIPHGHTRSYRSVARDIGHSNSFRAVGGACGKNPIAVFIPCHRVINADGRLGGFTGGLRKKRRLLVLEQKNSSGR